VRQCLPYSLQQLEGQHRLGYGAGTTRASNPTIFEWECSLGSALRGRGAIARGSVPPKPSKVCGNMPAYFVWTLKLLEAVILRNVDVRFTGHGRLERHQLFEMPSR